MMNSKTKLKTFVKLKLKLNNKPKRNSHSSTEFKWFKYCQKEMLFQSAGVCCGITHKQNISKLECGPMPNVMAALPNIGGALCWTPQSLADAQYWNAMQYSGPKFTILWGHVEEILLLNTFFLIVDTCLTCEDIAWRSCAMVHRWRFCAIFCILYFQRETCSTFQTCTRNLH